MNKIENKSNREMKQKSLIFETLNESDTHLERLTKKKTQRHKLLTSGTK